MNSEYRGNRGRQGFTRRDFLKAGGSVLAGTSILGLASCGQSSDSSPQEELQNLKFGYFSAFHTMVVFIADQAGFFEEEDLPVEMVLSNSGGLIPNLLVSGSADIANVAIDDAATSDDRLIHIFPLTTSMSMNTVINNDSLKQFDLSADSSPDEVIAAFPDMRVGITAPDSPTDTYSRYFIRQAGADPRDTEIVSIGGASNLLSALRTQQIDAFMLTPPTPNQAELEGFGTIVLKPSIGEGPEDLQRIPYTGISVTKNWAEQNEEVVTRFVRSLIKSAEFIKEDPAGTQEQLRAYFGDFDDETLAAGIEDMLPALPENPELTEDEVQKFLQVNSDAGTLDLENLPSTSEGNFWTNRYIEEAKA